MKVVGARWVIASRPPLASLLAACAGGIVLAVGLAERRRSLAIMSSWARTGASYAGSCSAKGSS